MVDFNRISFSIIIIIRVDDDDDDYNKGDRQGVLGVIVILEDWKKCCYYGCFDRVHQKKVYNNNNHNNQNDIHWSKVMAQAKATKKKSWMSLMTPKYCICDDDCLWLLGVFFSFFLLVICDVCISWWEWIIYRFLVTWIWILTLFPHWFKIPNS